MARYSIEIETRPNVYGTCVDAEVVRGPSFVRSYRGMEWAPTREEAYAKLTAKLSNRYPQHTFSFTHTDAQR